MMPLHQPLAPPKLEPLSRMRRGFSLIEICIVLVVLTIVGSLAVPAVARTLARQRVIAAAQHLATDIAQARYEAASQGLPMHIETKAGADWCWAVTKHAGCGCTGTPVCRLKVTHQADHPGVRLLSAQGMGLGLGLNPDGTSDPSVVATLEAGESQVRVEVGPMGRAKLCAPRGDIAGVKRC